MGRAKQQPWRKSPHGWIQLREAGELAANGWFDDFAASNRGIAYDGLNTTSVSGSGAVFKILLTGNVKRAFAKVSWDYWYEKSNKVLVELAEIKLKPKLTCWSCERRVIVERAVKPLDASSQRRFWHQCKEDFSAYVTNLTPEEDDAFQIVGLYRQRADAKTSLTSSRTNGDFPGSVRKKRR